jgi:hypothetical protein
MLAILIKRARDDGQINKVVPHLVDGDLSILQYADDTILFMENDLEKACNMKLLLCAFEKFSGFKIDFYKNELFWFGEAKESAAHYTELFGCSEGEFFLKYLGIFIHFRELSNAEETS